MSSIREKFLRDWETKFPSFPVPKEEDLEFLRRPKTLKVLEKSLDRCVRKTDELNAHISRQNFISEFILELMDSHSLDRDSPFDEGDSVDPPSTARCPAPLPRKDPGTVDEVKGAVSVGTPLEPNNSDTHLGKPPKSVPKNQNKGGGSVGAIDSPSRHPSVVQKKSSGSRSTVQGGEDAAKSSETGLIAGSGTEKENANEHQHSSGNIVDDTTGDLQLSCGSDSPKRSRPRPRRSDNYEEAIPFAASRGSELGERVLSDDEQEEESSPMYYSMLLFKQQTLDRAKMVYFNDEPSSQLAQQARKLSMRCNQFDRRAGCMSENFGDGAMDPVAQRQHRQSMVVVALSGFTEGQTDVDEIDAFVAPLCAEEEKLQMRRALVAGILDSEQDYVDVLDRLLRYMQAFKSLVDMGQSVITLTDIDTIFLKIPDLHQIHHLFIHGLRPKVEKWSNEQEVAEIFHQLAEKEYRIAPVYLKNYQRAISAVKRCSQENLQFRTLTEHVHVKGVDKVGSLEELLHKPVVRIQRNTLVLQDLINCTPPGHVDYDLLQKTHRAAQKFLNHFGNSSKQAAIDYQRYLVKSDIVVERVMTSRKLRHVFLFNDIFVCARQKVITKHHLTFEVEWSIPLVDLSISNSTVDSEESKKADRDPILRKIIVLQNDLKVEMKRAKASCELEHNRSLRMHTKNVEKIKKKLLEQKGLLMLESPSLPIIFHNKKCDRTFCLLLSSDYERTGWNSAMHGLLSKEVQPSVNLSTQDLNNMLNTIRLPKMCSFGSLFGQDNFCLEEEFLFGSLTITIQNLEGLKQSLNVYCCVEVDSFGHFLMQAKTKVILNSSEPNWNEDFDIDLEGAQTLRVLCYSVENGQSRLIGKNAYELSNDYLTREGRQEKILINEMSLSVFIIYRSREHTLKRTLSYAREGLFGVHIRAITQREGSRIPLIVTSCVEDIESRGMQDVGIYRVSGLASEVQRLRKAFEKNSHAATTLLKSTDVNVVAGLLKLYFRELPEALYTDAIYSELVKGMSFSDPEAKEKYMLNVIRKLPEPNYSTAIYIMDHLVRVSVLNNINKMTLQNLATVFGPTLLRPAVKEEEKTPGEKFVAGAREALTQVAILQHLLSLRAKLLPLMNEG